MMESAEQSHVDVHLCTLDGAENFREHFDILLVTHELPPSDIGFGEEKL